MKIVNDTKRNTQVYIRALKAGDCFELNGDVFMVLKLDTDLTSCADLDNGQVESCSGNTIVNRITATLTYTLGA